MSTDVEKLLREGMERFTADLRAPAGMAYRAARRRRRRLALRSATGAGAVLAAAAVALVVAGVPGAGGSGVRQPLVPAAYVVKHADSALSAAEPADVAQMTITTRARAHGRATTTTAKEWSHGDRWRLVTYSPAGHQVYDEGFGAASAYTLVNYRTHTWARQRGMARPARPALRSHGCGPVIAALPVLFRYGLPGIPGRFAASLPATAAGALRAAVSCGTLTVDGRQRVNGVEAIKLTSRPGSLISETIWVSPGTYLPVRVVVRSTAGAPALRQTADITWLPPTAKNLARLTVTVPAGFRRVPLAKAVKPILPRIQRLPLPKPKALCQAPAGLACEYRPALESPARNVAAIPRRGPLCPTGMRRGPGDVC